SDAQGPLPGVSVKVEGTTAGITTGADGSYSIQTAENAVLVFSFIGYAQQRIPVNSRTVIIVVMVPETRALDEIVVVGYGTQKKVNLTGSVSTVDSEELVKRPAANVALLLQGKVPGLQIIQNSAQPGMEDAS